MSKPTAVEARYAAELWKQMLRSPKYDNGDNTFGGTVASVLATKIPSNVTEEKLEAFGEHLVKGILATAEEWGSVSLYVDYGPTQELSDAADAAGLKMEFPWKTDVTVEAGKVGVRQGYAAEAVYHYLLDDGRWLLASLCGADVEKIKRYVTDGTLPEFRVVG
jgi:hypothetical protein